MKVNILLAAALLATATASFAAEPEGEKQDSQDAQQEKKICRSEKLTGSLTRVRRVCLTRAEWDRLAEGTRRNVHELDRDANQSRAAQIGGG